MVKTRAFWVYIMANTGGRAATLYTGATNNLERRVYEHKIPDHEKRPQSFAAKYRITRLVYFEEFQHVRDAIAREKQIKGWRRERKLTLIESINAEWHDLSEAWGEPPSARGMANDLGRSFAAAQDDGRCGCGENPLLYATVVP
jgi:putative endonuclease